MERRIVLISVKNLQENSIIELNTDNKILSKLIIDCQKIFLKPILGAEVYNQILEEVYQSSTNPSHVFNPDLKDLLDSYIQPYLIYAVLIDFIVVNQYKITNKGLLKINDSVATTISPDELAFAKNHFDNKMVNYKAMLIDRLKEKDYIKCTSKNDVDIASDSVGWYLDGFGKV